MARQRKPFVQDESLPDDDVIVIVDGATDDEIDERIADILCWLLDQDDLNKKR